MVRVLNFNKRENKFPSSPQLISTFLPRRYFLYVILGPVGATGEGMASVRWAEMGEVTPPSPAVADEWFRPLAKALRALYKANHSWTSRFVYGRTEVYVVSLNLCIRYVSFFSRIAVSRFSLVADTPL